MDFDFPSDAEMLRDMLRRFIQKDARPLEMKLFTTGRLEPEEKARLRTAIQQMGLWGATVPEAYGGGGLDLVTSCVIEEELGGTFVPIEIGEVPPLLYQCREAQVGAYLEPALAGERQPLLAAREPGAIRPESWTARAAPEGSGYRLEGRKALAGVPGANDFLIVLAQAPEGWTAFLLEPDAPGVTVGRNGSAALTLDGCAVEAASVLGAPGQALAALADEGPRAWIRTGARYVGLSARMLAMAVEHAREWVALGAPLAVRPAIQRMLAETRVEIQSARWLVYHAAWLAERDQPLRGPAAEVRLATGELLKRSIDRTTMIFGGPGPTPEIMPHRLARALVPSEVLEVALDVARSVVAAEVLAERP